MIRRFFAWLRTLFQQLPKDPEFEAAEVSAIITQECITMMSTSSRTDVRTMLMVCANAKHPTTPEFVIACFRKLAYVSQSFRDVIPEEYIPANIVTPNNWKVKARKVSKTSLQRQQDLKTWREKWAVEKLNKPSGYVGPQGKDGYPENAKSHEKLPEDQKN